LQDVVWSYSAKEHKLLYINDNAANALYGHSADDFYKYPSLWMEVVHPEDRPLVNEIRHELRRGGNPDKLYRIVNKNGETRWVHSRAWVTFDTEGRPLRYEGAVRDVNELMLAENARRENEARLQMVMEVGKIGIWELCLASKTVVWSKVLREICGLSPDITPSVDAFFEIIHPEDRKRVRAEYTAALKDGSQHRPEFRVVHKDGSIRWVQTLGRIMYIGEGQTKTLIGALTDVTESREMQRTIEAQRGKMMAASKMSALGEMASGLAHEINNPLAIIHGNSIVLKELAQKEKTFGTGKIEAIADTIRQTSDRISKITKSLRWFARDAEMDPFEEMTVTALVDETAEFCRERFRTHGISFTIEPIDPSLVLESQPLHISQVILNLLNIAHDAVEHSQKRWIKVLVRDTEERAEIRITDSGHGVPPALADKIFQPFFTTKEIGKGTGLGLSVARGIIESHLGSLTLDVDSANTCFVISIPKKQLNPRHPSKDRASAETLL
ncbi:MAG: PAS domain-containing protein, partial [Bdellovibrionota bacterium]